MSRLKRPARALGLLALVLYAIALMAGATNASAAGVWKVKGAPVTAELSPLVAVKEIESKTATILFSTKSGTKVEILCTTLQPINVKLKPEGFVFFEAQLKYTSCTTKLNGVLSKACEPVSEGTEPGVIKTKALKGALIENEKTFIVRFEPTTGETLANMEFSETCAIGGSSVPILGKFTLKDSAISTEALEHLASEGPLTSMTALGQPVTIDGSILFKLASAHSGLNWSGGTVAAPTPKWNLSGSEVTTALKPLLAVNELEGEDATMSTTIGGTKVEVLCTGAQLAGMKLEPSGALTTGSQIKFSGCLTKLNGTVSGVCEPSNEGIEPGAIASKALKGALIENEKTGLVRFEPSSGETLAVIETSPGCAIGEKISLLGKVTFKDKSLATESESHLVSVGALTELWVISKTEEHKVTTSGSAVVRLASTHAGLPWSGKVPGEVPPPPKGWSVNGTGVTAALAPFVGTSGLENKTASLLFTTKGGTKVEVLCTTLQTINVRLEPEGFVFFESQLKYTGCLTKLNGVLSKSCEPLSGGTEPGVIKTKLLKGALVENEKAAIVKFEPTSGTTLATIELGEACALGESVPVLGTLTLKDAAISTEAVEHLATEGPKATMTALGQPVTIDGSILLKLTGAHAGLKWSGIL